MGHTASYSPMACDIVGHGAPILFVHGFPLNRRMWQAQTAALAGTHRVIVPDLPGFGESIAGPPVATMEGYADGLIKLLDHLEVTEPVALCGLSMGGYIAYEFLRRYRSRVNKLILCDTKSAADPPEKRHERERSAQDVLVGGLDKLTQKLPATLLGERTLGERPDIVAAVRGMIAECSRESVAAALRGMAQRVDSTDFLPRIDVPTLVLCGEEDTISPVAEMRAMADAIPDSMFAIIPLAGHLSPLENPESVNAALRRFLEGTESAVAND